MITTTAVPVSLSGIAILDMSTLWFYHGRPKDDGRIGPLTKTPRHPISGRRSITEILYLKYFETSTNTDDILKIITHLVNNI